MYKKLIVAVVGALVMAAYTYFDDDYISTLEWVQVVGTGVGAFLVWLTANGQPGTGWAYAKTAAYAASAGVASLLVTMNDGDFSQHDLFTLAIAVLTGAGVLLVQGPPRAETPLDKQPA